LVKTFRDLYTSMAGSSLKEKLEGLSRVLGSRFKEALKLVEQGRVRRYVFKPSGRVLWTVAGREGVYEVIPEAPYCSCDDFYFRVLNGKAPLCYHLIAQGLAEATGRYVTVEEDDSVYDEFVSVFRRLRRLGKPKTYVRYRDEVRDRVEALLKEGPMRARDILREVLAMGFEIPSVNSLAGFLRNDPKRRFICDKGLWMLRRR